MNIKGYLLIILGDNKLKLGKLSHRVNINSYKYWVKITSLVIKI